MNVQEKKKMKRWLLPLLLLFLVNGVSCSDDDVDPDLPEYKVIELNTEDHRFEELKTINVLTDIKCQTNTDDIFRLVIRNDSAFISYFGSLLYPTRLPSDFPIYGNPFIFSGTVMASPEGVDYYPLILEEFKYETLQAM